MKQLLFFFSFIFLLTTSYAQTELWGMTAAGGQFNKGVIFKTDGSGNNQTVEYSCYKVAGESPSYTHLIEATDGKLYGMTSEGGAVTNTLGVLFQYDPNTNIYAKKVNFTGLNGAGPKASLVQASDGKLYGMTPGGGATYDGVLFQYDPVTDIYTKKFDFGSVNGTWPQGSLIEAADGKLYGLTEYGGAGSGSGVLFQYDPATNVYTKKVDFYLSATGERPRGSLLQASNGKLYGTTKNGGANNSGVIFEYDPITNIYNETFSFVSVTGIMDGSLIQASDGKLYGMMNAGGTNNMGVIFQYDIITHTCVATFNFDGAAHGANPKASLMQATDGMLYGMTYYGGVGDVGVVFQYNPTNASVTKKYDYNFPVGRYPEGSLMQASNGKLYGMVRYSGAYGLGSIFEYEPTTSSYTTKINFGESKDGAQPNGSLMKASDGKLYGITQSGGVNKMGVLFQYDPITHVYTKKYDFAAVSGNFPKGSLMQASDGMLYGMTTSGGGGAGVLYQYNPSTNVYSVKVNFMGISNGSSPHGTLIQATDGYLYGVTFDGGATNNGVLFKYDILMSTYTKMVDFDDVSKGKWPSGTLIQASNGNLYGLTQNGGVNNVGVLFQFDPVTSTFTKKLDFNLSIDGHLPTNSLVQAIDGKLYGTTQNGGVNNVGVIFQYDINTNTYAKKIDLAMPTGGYPFAGLTQATNGNLYGLTWYGGAKSAGVMFQYNPASNIYTKKLDFDTTNGCNPALTNLIEIPIAPSHAIQTGSVVSTICRGSSINIAYTVTGTYTAGNVFNAELSDASGSFSSAVSIGSISATSSGTINVNIPLLAALGSGYRVRVVSTNPAVNGNDNGSNITLNPLPTLTVTGTNTVCLGTSTGFIANGALTYVWNTAQTTSSISINPTSTTIYTVWGTNMNGCVNSQTVSVTVDNTCADVWPGDANSDGAADNLDVLELGLHYTQTGAPRTTTSNNWQSYFANNWTGTISNGSNLNHSDCNGDGVINDDDTLAIFNNYGLMHTFKPVQTNTVNPQLSIVPDQPMVVKGMWGTASVYLGDATNPINNINGIAYTIDFDNTLIESNNIYIEYQNSFIDAGQNLHFQKSDFASGKIYSATTHTLSNNVSGFGKIATLHYQISSALTTDQTLTLGVSQVNQSNATGLITPLTSGTGTLMAIGTSVGVKEVLMSGNVLISPNPTNGLLNIKFSSLPQNIKIELYNSIGALVVTETMNNKNNTINISDLSSGMYFMKVLEGYKVFAVKKVLKD